MKFLTFSLSLYSLLPLQRCCAYDATPFLSVGCLLTGGMDDEVHLMDVVRVDVERGLHWGRFQDDGGFCIAACTARWWTSVGCARATRPKKRSLLARNISETGWHGVTCLTSTFVTCFVQGMRRIFRKHQQSNESMRRHSSFVVVQVTEP